MTHTILKSLAAVVAMSLSVAPSAVFAQNTGDVTAQANVLTPLTVTPQVTLDFLNVFPGVNKSVPITDVNAGRWLNAGAASAELTLGFTLPTNLTNGGNDLPISFSASDAGYNTTNVPGGATSFDPSVGATTNLGAGPAELYVWIGGTVTPAVGQVSGLYTGLVTLTVNYTGN